MLCSALQHTTTGLRLAASQANGKPMQAWLAKASQCLASAASQGQPSPPTPAKQQQEVHAPFALLALLLDPWVQSPPARHSISICQAQTARINSHPNSPGKHLPSALGVVSDQTGYSTTLFLKNVTSKRRLKALKELYGAEEWDALDAERIAEDGDLVEVDLTFYQVRTCINCFEVTGCCKSPTRELGAS
jgi:hypothetical protein